MEASVEQFKERARNTWAAGNFDEIAKTILGVGQKVVDAADIHPGVTVLDVACGSGNATIPAAVAGGRCTGLDLVPDLLEHGRRHADEAGVEVEWITADAEDLPFEDARFDHVLSALGVQFAPRHEVTTAELVRVCRPGGTIAVGNWAADGYIGRFWTVMGPYMPPLPDYASPPPRWGRPDDVERLFAPHPVDLQIERATLHFEADSPEAFIDFMAECYGPLLGASRALDGRWPALRADLIALSNEMNVEPGRFRAPSDYLVIVARKRD